MAAYLFVWNPKKWEWSSLDAAVDELEQTGQFREKWSCQSHKSIALGDRAFLLRLGLEPKGIMASGHVATPPFMSQHWSGEDKLVPRVVIDFDTLIHPERGALLGIDRLQRDRLREQEWTPQASGISIRPHLVNELEALWFAHLQSSNTCNGHVGTTVADSPTTFSEGTQYRAEVSFYERNPHARRICLDHHGYSCSVCSMDFESVYGAIGKGFIHVHHLQPLSTAASSTQVDPIEDMRPVCPNCHAMLHRKSPPIGIKDLASLMRST